MKEQLDRIEEKLDLALRTVASHEAHIGWLKTTVKAVVGTVATSLLAAVGYLLRRATGG